LGTTSEPQIITVNGKYIESPISYEISGTGSELFTIEQESWHSYEGGTLSVTFTPDATKIYSVKVTFSSLGATPKSISLKGSGTSVAIDEQEATDGVTIYPNPTTGELIINNEQLTINNVEIYDVMGRMVKTRFIASLQDDTTTFDISCLPSGIYFLRIQTENGVVTKKVVKM
jgi:hypothetical protein